MKRLYVSLAVVALAVGLLNPPTVFGGAIPSADNCAFYLDLEKDIGCWFQDANSSDYLVKYGYKYCSIFKNRSAVWNDERTTWVKKAAVCLQEALKDPVVPVDCIKLENQAFDSHPGCYRKGGFCNLSRTQKTSIVWTAFGADTLLSPRKSFYQALKLLGDCLTLDSQTVVALYQRANNLADTGRYSRSKLADLFWVNKMPESKFEDYAQFALKKLLGENHGTPSASINAFEALYKSDSTADMSFGRIERDCLQKQNTKSSTCTRANEMIGSSNAFESLKAIPHTIDPGVIEQILEYKQKLENAAEKNHSN